MFGTCRRKGSKAPKTFSNILEQVREIKEDHRRDGKTDF
jgi:hypothetical protein